MTRRRIWFVGCLVMYGVTMTAVVGSLWQARKWATQELSRPNAAAEWQTWKDDVAASNERSDAPVKRRGHKSAEPPTLVLLRDEFAGVVGSALLMASLLYAAAALFVWGVFFAETRERGVAPNDRADVRSTGHDAS